MSDNVKQTDTAPVAVEIPKSVAETAPATQAATAAPAPGSDARGGRGGGQGGRGGRGGGQGGRGGRRDRDNRNQAPQAESDLVDKVVHINRCSKVIKGGRRFSFSALVVVGNKKGSVGVGFGKANEVADAVKKATENARRQLEPIALLDGTIPHQVFGVFDGGKVLLKPASPGTGIIAGSAVRAVVEAAGVKDVLTKSLGSDNPYNVVKATLEGLRTLKSPESIFRARGKTYRPRVKASTPSIEPVAA
jgi:small subunit ribosomal protein S5